MTSKSKAKAIATREAKYAGKSLADGAVVWSIDELKALVVNALLKHANFFSLQKAALAHALDDAQKIVLPKNRWRPYVSIEIGTRSGRLPRMLEQLRGVLEPAAKPFAAEPKNTKVHLTLAEFSALAHHPQVKPLLDKNALAPVGLVVASVNRAQLDVLAPDRRRDTKAWRQLYYREARNTKGTKRDLMSMLREGMRFPPPTIVKTEPPDQPPAVPAVHVSEPPMNTFTVPAVSSPLGAALAAFAAQALPAAEAFLGRIIDARVAPLQARIDELQAKLDAVDGKVRDTLIDVIGAPQGVKEPTPPPVELKALPVVTPESLPRVDIVGLLNGQVELVKQAVGDRFVLRFLTADEVLRRNVTAPNAIMLSKFVKHDAQDRIRKSGAKLHYANGGPESVIAQLKQIAAAHAH